jgi:tetratricopeptide (TPR) repeat protein
MGLGNLCLKNGEEDRAIELLQKAVQAAMKAFEPRFLLGSAYNRVGRYQDALDQLQYSVKLGANESEVYYHLARAYGGLGRQEERAQALARFAQITKKSKEDVEGQRRALSLMDEAKSLVDAGNLHLAAARMEEARELRPSDDRLLFRLASLQYDLKRYDLAQGYAQEAIALAPSEWLYHYLAGLIAKDAGKWRQARNSLETAARLNASAAEVQNALGEVAVHEGNFQGAIAAFERAVKLNPDERAYRLNLEAARQPKR